MTYARGNTVRFTPDSSMHWVVDVTSLGEKDHVTLPVIGWAVVAEDPGNEDYPGLETSVQPVVIGHEYRPENESEYRLYEGESRVSFDLRFVQPDEWEKETVKR